MEEGALLNGETRAPTVRRARPEDLDAIVRLWRRMWDEHAPLDERFRATPAADSVMAGWYEGNLEGERSALLVAEREGQVVGYCLALIQENPPVVPWQFHGLISEISADPRSEGTGGALLEAAHAWFRTRGIPYVEVSVSVRNAPAGRFWRRHGYGEFLERLRLEL